MNYSGKARGVFKFMVRENNGLSVFSPCISWESRVGQQVKNRCAQREAALKDNKVSVFIAHRG